jgi:large subunit ribosomal protein L9
VKLILREDVENLGKGGELVDVKPGYGRNFLLPRGLAVLANSKNVREIDHQKNVASAKAAKLKASAEAVAKRLADTAITLKRKVGEQDKLYGSVTALDLAEALASRGLQIDRRTIDLSEPIKTLGDFEVPVKLHSDVVGKVKVKIEAEPKPRACRPGTSTGVVQRGRPSPFRARQRPASEEHCTPAPLPGAVGRHPITP